MPRPTHATTRPIEASDLLHLEIPTDPQIDRDGTRVVFVVKRVDSSSTYATSIHIASCDGAPRARHLTKGPRDRSPRWSPDARRLLFVTESEKGSPQLVLAAVTGVRVGRPATITRLAPGSIGDVRWSPTGREVAFAYRATDPERTVAAAKRRERSKASTPPVEVADPWYRLDGDGVFGAARYGLHIVDIASRRVRTIDLGDSMGTFSFDWSPDGRSIAATVNRSKTALIALWKCEVVIVDARNGRGRTLGGLPEGPKGFVAWSPDGASIAYAGRCGRDSAYSTANLGLFVHNLSTRKTRDLLASTDLCMLAATLTDSAETGFSAWFRFLPDGESIVLRAGWHGSGHLASVGLRDSMVAIHTPEGAEHIPASLSGDGSRIALVRTAPTEPAEVCIADIVGREFPVRQLTTLNGALADSLQLVHPEERWITASDGSPIHYWILRPRTVSRRRGPGILTVHGGPHAQYGCAFFLEFQLLAAQGYTVYYGNPRGSKGYGMRHCAAIRGAWGTKDWLDIQAITRAMKRDTRVDPKRIGIMGGSYGGYMATWAVSHSRSYCAAIADRCVSNLVSQAGSSDYPEVPGEYWKGSAFGDPSALWRASPIAHFSKARTPMLLIHSEGDLRCNIEQSEQIHAALVVQGVPVRFVRYPRETSHGMSRSGPPDLRIHRLNEITRWWRDSTTSPGSPSSRRRSLGLPSPARR